LPVNALPDGYKEPIGNVVHMQFENWTRMFIPPVSGKVLASLPDGSSKPEALTLRLVVGRVLRHL